MAHIQKHKAHHMLHTTFSHVYTINCGLLAIRAHHLLSPVFWLCTISKVALNVLSACVCLNNTLFKHVSAHRISMPAKLPIKKSDNNVKSTSKLKEIYTRRLKSHVCNKCCRFFIQLIGITGML